MSGRRWLRLCVRLALLAHPRRRREADGDEIAASVEAAFAARRARGGWAAWMLALRMGGDLVASGVRERRRVRGERRQEGGVMGWIDGWSDARVAARTLARSPGFAAAAVGVLALGIGVNAALFSAVRATLMADPPYPEHERIAVLDLTDSSTVRPGPARPFPWSYPKFRLMREMDLPLERAGAYASRRLTLTGAGDAAYLAAELVTPGYLEILGVAPVAGRRFTAGEDEEGAPLVAILGHEFWRERFGADPGVVGRDVTLNARPVTVVGVAPSGFRGLTGRADLWVPVHTGAALTAPFLVRGAQAHWLVGIGKLRPGTDPAALDARMREVGSAVEAAWPNSDPTGVRGGSARALSDAWVNPEARASLLVLAVAAALLLLAACANLAALLVARASARAREAAVRVALGAGRWRVARGFLAESLIVSLAGAAAGVGVARLSLEALAGLWPARFVDARWNVSAAAVDGVGLDPWVLLFAVALAVGTGLLLGVVPALSVGQADPLARLRGVTGGARPRRGGWDVKDVLVAGETALALVLLVGAGLLLRSLAELRAVDRGFEPDGLLSFEFSLARGTRWAEDRAAFAERYLERLRGLPGVESAAVGCAPPLAGHCTITAVREAGDRAWSEGSRPSIGVHYVSDDFFRTLGVPVLQGRTFTSEDRADTRPVVVLSQAAVDELFPAGDALGRAVAMGIDLTPHDGPAAEVVGVVGDALFDRPANGIMPEAFVSHRQEEMGSSVLLRVRGKPMAVVAEARAALGELDPDVPLFGVRTVADLEARASGDTRILGTLLSAFSALALILAGAGVWSVVAFSVARRTREIGVRVALGADGGSVVRDSIRRGILPSLAGVALGAVGAWTTSRVLGSVLFGVRPADPLAFAGAAALLLCAALAAAWLPARRAARVDPVVALRSE